MGTTPIFAEILIVGGQTCAWLYVGSSALSGEWIAPAPETEINEALLAAVAIGAAYTLGVVVDRVADRCVSLLRPRLPKWAKPYPKNKKGQIDFGKVKIGIRAEGGEAVSFLEYLRSRIRIARATTFNAFMGAISFALASVGPLTKPLSTWNDAAVPIGLCLALCLTSSLTFRSLSRTFDERALDLYSILDKQKRSGPKS